MLNLELSSNTINSNGNYNDDTIYRCKKNLQLALFWPYANNSYKDISTLRLLAQCSPIPSQQTCKISLNISFFYFQTKKSEIIKKNGRHLSFDACRNTRQLAK